MNLLGTETSPYLLQHRNNPVHWRPWSATALEAARAADKPVLLSVGYASCHWCHVMAHECFENEAIAALMNELFINIKVDREERPDVDKLYMDALHALGEQGGWPLTIFLDGDGAPFWGGTYFPPEPRYGRPGFPHVLREISRLWRKDRALITTNTSALKDALNRRAQPAAAAALTPRDASAAASAILPYVDLNHGGLKGAPKFPQVPLFRFLWAAGLPSTNASLLDAVDITLQHICQGGIYDHIGGGFARYSVDHRWLVPHFEKMLYDNAQLLSLLSRVWLRTQRELFRVRIEETIAFALNDMLLPDGGFASSFDADSEGVEGKYYIWSYPDILQALGTDAREFTKHYDISEQGNWEGRSIPNRLHAVAGHPRPMPEAINTLLRIRRSRLPPAFDDKLLADWNGLMVQALAEAAVTFQRYDWVRIATETFRTVISKLWTGDHLAQSHRQNRAQHLATAEGYANLIAAALALLPFEPSSITTAIKLLEALDRDFWTGSAYSFASAKASDLITRQVFGEDNATPNANGIMAVNLIRMASLTGDFAYRAKADTILKTFASEARANPFGFPSLFAAKLFFDNTIEIKSDADHPLLSAILKRTGLDVVLMPRASAPGTALICRNAACSLPIESEQDIDGALALLRLT